MFIVYVKVSLWDQAFQVNDQPTQLVVPAGLWKLAIVVIGPQSKPNWAWCWTRNSVPSIPTPGLVHTTPHRVPPSIHPSIVRVPQVPTSAALKLIVILSIEVSCTSGVPSKICEIEVHPGEAIVDASHCIFVGPETVLLGNPLFCISPASADVTNHKPATRAVAVCLRFQRSHPVFVGWIDFCGALSDVLATIVIL